MSFTLVPAIERRPYGPDASVAEQVAIRARVRWLEDDIIECREVPVMTRFTVDLVFDALWELAADWQRFAILVDARESQRPSAELREQVRRRAAELSPRVRHVALVVDGLLTRVAAPFILTKLPFISTSVHSDREDAIGVLRRGSG